MKRVLVLMMVVTVSWFNIVLIVHVTCEIKYIFSVVGIDFQSITFTGTEGDSVLSSQVVLLTSLV